MQILLSLRKEKGFTQKYIADQLGISRQAYANYEAGNREPDLATLVKISQLFDVSVDTLLSNNYTPVVAEDDVKVALFGGDGEVTEEMWNEVKQYAEYIKAKYQK